MSNEELTEPGKKKEFYVAVILSVLILDVLCIRHKVFLFDTKDI